jgi:U2 small nuclear ribonucleoprotein B''
VRWVGHWLVLLRFCVVLIVLFHSRYGGFKEVRMIPSKAVAFIEFDNEATSTIAMQALNNYRLSETNFLALSYAKR